MKNQTHVSLCIALMTAIAGHACGGEIEPPAGPIAPTMKSLDQIEPRICINDLPGNQGAVHVITESGNYYLTGDIHGEAGKSGIVVDLATDTTDDPVSIDMNGFSCIGVPGSLHGIEVPNRAGVRVERFHVRQEFGQQSGTRGWGGDGINVSGADECVLLGIDSTDNGGAGYRSSGGIRFKAGADLSKKVNIANNGGGGSGGGILIFGSRSMSLDSMVIRDNMGDGIRISITDPIDLRESISMDSMDINGNVGDGIEIDHSSGNSLRVGIRRASIDANIGDGMRITTNGDESLDASLDEMYVTGNGGNGIHFNPLATGGTMSIRLTDSTFASNVLSGMRCVGDQGDRDLSIRAENTVATTNGVHGFDTVANDETYVRCEASDNTQDGFHNLAIPFALRPLDPRSILKSYFETGAKRNGGDGVHTEQCSATFNICHFISNGGDGAQSSGGAVYMERCVLDDNSGSGLRSSDSPIFVAQSTASNNILYGIDAGNPSGGASSSMIDCVVRSNSEGGVRIEGGHVTCECTHLIANGGGLGGGTGSGMGITDAASVCITDSSATGNTGAGFEINNSASGIPPIAFKLDRLMASGNGVSGIAVAEADFGQMTHCVTNSNGGDGVFLDAASTGMVLQSCISSNNAFNGYNLVGSGHILVDNSAAGNVAGAIKAVVPGNTIGPAVDEVGVIQNGNPGGNYVR